MKKNTLSLTILFLMSLVLNSCNKIDIWDIIKDDKPDEIATADVATDWYKLQLGILLERNSAFNGVYFGYIGTGLYEATRHQTKHSASFSQSLNQMPQMPAPAEFKTYDWQVSANAALASMVRSFYGGLTPANNASIDSLENAHNKKLSAGLGAATFERSQEYGRSVATAIYNWSLSGNFNPSNAGYVPPIFPGSWVPTPPAFANGVMPYISSARTFLASNTTAKAAPFPFAYSELPGSDFYKMVYNVYNVGQTLTGEQERIALFFVDQGNGIGYTPPGHDFSILTQALEQNHANLATAAEAYAKAGIAEWDATIICFRSKYMYNLIRPVTYINKLIDPNWKPFIATPPHPEYPAAHAFITGAVMQAAANVMGHNVKVVDHTYDFRGWSPRTYTSLLKAGEEAGISRLYGGIHYQTSIDIGLSLGLELGNKIGTIKLRN